MSDTGQIIDAMKADGFTVRQIAQALGLSTQAVYYHLNKPTKADDGS